MRRLTGDTIFESSQLSQDLAGKSVRGGVTTMGAQGVQFVLHLVVILPFEYLATSINVILPRRRWFRLADVLS